MTGPAVAVVIPAYRQPALLPEAIAAVLAQDAAAAVVIEDGCPMPGTRAVATAFAAAHPGRVFALTQPNAGLAAARNAGIAFVLGAWPDTEAIYFLDADNRLYPGALDRWLAALRAAPAAVGWLYPDIDELGGGGNWSTAGDFSRLALLAENYCEAGSLVRRAVFAAGLRFDTELRIGWEDWDFWQSAAAQGWVGQHHPAAGLRYRRRPESMLADADRQGSLLLATLRAKHAAARSPRAVLALETAEAPPLALHLEGAGEVALQADPGAAPVEVLTPAAARARFLVSEARPRAVHFPAVLAFAEADAWALLGAHGLLRGVLWRANVALRECDVVAVRLDAAADTLGTTLLPATGPELAAAPILLVRRGLLEAAGAAALEAVLGTTCVEPALATAPGADPTGLAAPGRPTAADDPDHAVAGDAASWDPGAALPEPTHAAALLRVTLPAASGLPPGSPNDGVTAEAGVALRHLALAAAALRLGRRVAPPAPPDWRQPVRVKLHTAAARVRGEAGIGAVLPVTPGRRTIGFVVPMFALGGVEQVILAQAALLRARGWRTRLVVFGRAAAERAAGAVAAFDDIVCVAGLGEAADPAGRYFAAPVSGFGAAPAAADLLGLLADLDVLLCTHTAAAQPLLAPLRRLGVRIWAGLHQTERDPWGAPQGSPEALLGHEHVLDGILVPSARLRADAVALGFPPEKLWLVRNAPTLPPGAAQGQRAARQGRLRALWLGRLDAQKGVDRLPAILAETREAVDWRVVGKAVIDAGPAPLGVPVEPPARTPEAVAALLGWADVLVLPSRYEGVPLTVLEAQAAGCVVLATDVGGVPEIVADGVDGLLVGHAAPEPVVIAAFVAALRRLAADRAGCMRLGGAAAARVAGSGWETTMRAWLDHLEATVPRR